MRPRGDLAHPHVREAMVRTQIAARGVRDPAVLRAVGEVPREAFLPDRVREMAYEDAPVPLGCGQTVSQPYVVALMTEALELEPGDRVLEIGTGSGYAAAILSRIAREVYTIERHEELARFASERLDAVGYDNVHVRHGDGTLGWPEAAPFDGIVVAAGGPSVPESLKRQLAIGGRLVIPIGVDPTSQELVRVTRTGADAFERERLGGVRFVPLIGAEGWEGEAGAPAAAFAGDVRGARATHSVERLVAEGGVVVPGMEAATRVLSDLASLRRRALWPVGPRHLWADALGVMLHVSLAAELEDPQWLDRAEDVVETAERALGLPIGLRLGDAPRHAVQDWHGLCNWIQALGALGEHRPAHRRRAIDLARALVPRFLVPGVGVHPRMRTDLAGPAPGSRPDALAALHGLVVLRLLGAEELDAEIATLRALVDRDVPRLHVEGDLACGLVLWLVHVYPDEVWARILRGRALSALDLLWTDPPGLFCREPGCRELRLAFANRVVCIGLQAAGVHADRVRRVQAVLDAEARRDETRRPGERRPGVGGEREPDELVALTALAACASRLPGAWLRRAAATDVRSSAGDRS